MGRMGRKLRQYGRVIRMLPVAVYRHFRNSQSLGMLSLLLCLLLGIILLAVIKGCSASPAAPHADSVPEVPQVSTTSVPTPTPAPVSITLSFAGDCTLGMDSSFSYNSSFNAYYDAYGPAYFLENVRSIFAADDLTVVNFEGTLTESTGRADKSWAFQGDAQYAQVLTEGAVEAVNLANNHTHDYGAQGFLDTQQALDHCGLVHFGFDDTALVEVKGVKVGLLGLYTVYTDSSYPEILRSLISSLRDQGAQVIVASFHWGMENSDIPEDDQIALAHAAVDAGANLVIGHHPHVLQGIERYRGSYICYSLGNFCFGGNFDPNDYDTVIVQQTFTVTGSQVDTTGGLHVIPCSISSTDTQNNYQPTPAQEDQSQRILDRLRRLSDGLGTENAMDTVTH